MGQTSGDARLYEVLLRRGINAAIAFSQNRALQEARLGGYRSSIELKELIAKNAVAEVRQITSNIRAANLPQSLNKLLEAGSKKDALKIIEEDFILQEDDFVRFIANSEVFGFIHERKHREFVPEDLKNLNHEAFGKMDPLTKELTKEAQKVSRKIRQIIKTRKQLSVHWFHFGFNWHCFYFDFGDLLKGHWIRYSARSRNRC